MPHIDSTIAHHLVKLCRERVEKATPDLLVLEQLVVDLAYERDCWRESYENR